MPEIDKRLTKHWKAVRTNKANPDQLSHAHLHNAEASDAASQKAGHAVDVYWSPILKISDVSIGLVKSQDKPNGEEITFLHFEGRKQKLGLNSTNSKTLESLSGSPVPVRWIGMTIQLYVDPKAKYPKGEKGPAIRIKPMRPAGPADAPHPEPRPEDVERLERARDERINGNDDDASGREPGED
ncbi:MAG: hypothetical protein JWP97_5741 [Labilithrix sp.]|nr:hypothetical protein [Labilithrix sp.]